MELIENPWMELEQGPSLVLERDLGFVEKHNGVARPEHRIMVNSIPEPFIGDPETAKLVLLSLNPGHSDSDEEHHRRTEIRSLMLRNLRHENKDFPFYPLSPVFKGTGVEKYWRKRTRKLQIEAGLNDEEFSKKLLVIEWFPYHSERSGLRVEKKCESQKDSFQCTRQMLAKEKEGVQVLGIRSKKFWAAVDPAFGAIPYLNSPQSGHISRGNMESSLFDRIVKLLKG